ncbi:MAG: hypothetical protein QG596_1840 [Actinomycetota bacterium]|jgi:hypothetical protein|nr:hypothetical protein [Actinomycetota bacterium]
MRRSQHSQGKAARTGLLTTFVMAALFLSFAGSASALETTIISGPADGETITVDSAIFVFNSDDPEATFECSIEGRSFKPCSSPISMEDLEDGRHSFAVRAQGDSTPDVRKFKVELPDPPVTPSARCLAAIKGAKAAKVKLNRAKSRKAPTKAAKKAKAKAIAEAKAGLKLANGKVNRAC